MPVLTAVRTYSKVGHTVKSMGSRICNFIPTFLQPAPEHLLHHYVTARKIEDLEKAYAGYIECYFFFKKYMKVYSCMS